jgi:osmotically-inducible protein OsmY
MRKTRSHWALLGGIGLGAALMYMFDADNGRRRRALASDQTGRALRRGGRAVKAMARDLSQRALGVAAGAKARLRRAAEEVPDSLLLERVRAALGHLVSNPGALEVLAEEGRVTLSGPVLKREANRLLRKTRRIPGVRSVASRLERLERFEPLGHLTGQAAG